MVGILRLYSRRKRPAGYVVRHDAPDHHRVDMLECALLAPSRDPATETQIADIHREFGDRDGRPIAKAILRQYDLRAGLDAALRKGWTW